MNHMEHRVPPLHRQAAIPLPIRDNSDEHDSDDDPVVLHRQVCLRPSRPDPEFKRQKLRHGDTMELPLHVKSDSPERKPKVTNKAQTRAVLSFDGQNDGRVNLSFIDQAPNHGTAIQQSNPSIPKPGKPAPFFRHAKHNIKMYCGPGYEKFPIAFRNDNQDHVKVCNDWSIKEARKKMVQAFTSDQYLNGEPETESDSDEDDRANVHAWTAADLNEQTVLSQVLEVFPDIEHAFVRTKIRSAYETYRSAGMAYGEGLDTSEIVEQILTGPAYPRQQKESQPASQSFEAETGRTIQWNRDNRKANEYLKDAVIVLANEFDHVPTHFISEIVTKNKTIFDSYLFLQDADDNFFSRSDKPYKRLKHPRGEIEKKYQRGRDIESHTKSAQYADVIDELMAAKQKAERERLRKKNEAKDAEDEATNLEVHKLQGQLVQCQCCFDEEIPLNRAVHCQAEVFHWICFDCVRGLADSQIGSMKYEMLCVEPGKCQEKLSLDGLAQALSVRTLDRLAFNQQQAEIVAAQIEGLEQCPHCDFKAIVDSIEIETIFSCQNPDCFKVTCRKCMEPSHLPKTCEEVKKDRSLSARHTVEEARSSAMMRECPRCKTKLIKESGCNKMSCSCGCLFCYVCNADLSSLRDGYEHFNARGSKCPLYDGPDGVARHDRDANQAEEDAIKRACADYEDVAEEELRIETGKSRKAENGRAKDGNGILNRPRQHLQNVAMVHAHLRDQARRMEGLYRERQQPRAFEARAPTNMRRLQRLHLPQAPLLPQLPRPQNPPVVGPLNPRPCPNLWPADQDIGMGWEQARRIHEFHRDTARRRNNIQNRPNEANFIQPAQHGRNEPHPNPIRCQTEPQVDRMQFEPLNYLRRRRDQVRDERGRQWRSNKQQRRDRGVAFDGDNPQNDIAMDNIPVDPPPYPRDILPWLQPWNAVSPEGLPKIKYEATEIKDSANTNRAERSEHHTGLEFSDDYLFRNPDVNDQQAWKALGNDEQFLEGLALEPFRERDRTRRERAKAAGKGQVRQRNLRDSSVEGWLGTSDADNDVDMEDLLWKDDFLDANDHENVEAGPARDGRAPPLPATNGLPDTGDWWAPGRLDQHPLNRRATMPPLTNNGLGGREGHYFQEDSGRDLPGWAANWAV